MIMWSTVDQHAELWEVWKVIGNIHFDRIGKLIR